MINTRLFPALTIETTRSPSLKKLFVIFRQFPVLRDSEWNAEAKRICQYLQIFRPAVLWYAPNLFKTFPPGVFCNKKKKMSTI